MKIIKIISKWSKTNENGLDIDCGLGDDGKLYYRLQNPVTKKHYPKWYPLSDRYTPSLKEMKCIVKEFGHLVVFT